MFEFLVTFRLRIFEFLSESVFEVKNKILLWKLVREVEWKMKQYKISDFIPF